MGRPGGSSTRSCSPTRAITSTRSSSTAAGYFSYFGAATHGSTASAPYYSYDLGTWHLVSLDSGCSDSGCGDVVQGQTTSAQTAWLQSDLAAHPAACTLAYWHHPRFSSSWAGDSPGTGPLFSALYNAHADIVLSGHDHVYERYTQQDPTGTATTNGVREFVVGTGGENLMTIVSAEPNMQASDASDFGVLVLTLHATSYDWAFNRLDGSVVDSGTTVCHGSGTGSASARAARAARAWPVGPTGRPFSLNVRPQSATLAAVARHGLPVLVHMTRAANMTIKVSVRRGRRLTQIASFYTTESQISRPYTRLHLPLPSRWLRGRGPVTLVLRFAVIDNINVAVADLLGERTNHHPTISKTITIRRH